MTTIIDDSNTEEHILNRDASSLSESCHLSLLREEKTLTSAIKFPLLPGRIHTHLLTTAARVLTKVSPIHRDAVGRSIIQLVAHWPYEEFHVPDIADGGLLLFEGQWKTGSLQQLLLTGFVNTAPSSKLKRIYYTNRTAISSVFQLPLLALSTKQRLSDKVLRALHQKWGSLVEQDVDKTFTDAIAWKMAELEEVCPEGATCSDRTIEVHTDCQLSLGDWLSMVSEVLGLTLQDLGPFRFKISKLAINNYKKQWLPQLKWILMLVHKDVLNKFIVYGKRKSMDLIMWDISEELRLLPGLQAFGLGTSGPKLCMRGDNDPSAEDMLCSTVQSFSQWRYLREVFLIGLVLTGVLEYWLGAVCSGQLQELSVIACSLVHRDIQYLSQCPHTATLEKLILEHNNLQGTGDMLCALVDRAPNLIILNVKESTLSFPEMAALLQRLSQLQNLETLAMYEEEIPLEVEEYVDLVRLACQVKPLKRFYVFPFNYKPFEMHRRRPVEMACKQILTEAGRPDLHLHYSGLCGLEAFDD